MSSQKVIFLHLGANKTGSSAIQTFLSLNHLRLREEGFVVPNAKLEVAKEIEGHHVWTVQELLGQEDGRLRLEQAVAQIEATVDAHTIVISAENLAANPRAPELFIGLAKTHDLKLLLYIRRQDEFLLSSWQQWYSKVSDDFWAWAIREIGSLGNWKHYLQAWEAVVPKEFITVRVFEKGRLAGGDAISDFHEQLGLRAPIDQFARPKETVNPSFSDAVMDLVKGNDLIFSNSHDNDFYNIVHRLTGGRYLKNRRESILTHKQRVAILGKYADSNKWVRDNYFGDQPLFAPPQEADYDYLTPEAMTRKQMEFLVTMMYRMREEGRK